MNDEQREKTITDFLENNESGEERKILALEVGTAELIESDVFKEEIGKLGVEGLAGKSQDWRGDMLDRAYHEDKLSVEKERLCYHRKDKSTLLAPHEEH